MISYQLTQVILYTQLESRNQSLNNLKSTVKIVKSKGGIMMEINTQLSEYLDLLKMKYVWNDEEKLFELDFTERKDEEPATHTPEGDEDKYFRYTIKIKPGEKWIQVFCDIYELENIPQTKRDDVFLELLTMNRRYAEVCYDFDDSRGVIGTSQEMQITGLNFDVFREEFLAVPWSVKKFWTEVATKFEFV